MKSVLIVGSSKQPIPAVNGGAVPALVEELINQNEKKNKMILSCISIYDIEAEKKSKKYHRTKFIWAKVPAIVAIADNLIAKVMQIGGRVHSFGFIFQIMWFTTFVSKVLNRNNYDAVIFENSIPVLYALKRYGNAKRYQGKWFLHMHTVPREYYGIKDLVSSSKKIIVISKYVKKAMLKQLGLDDNRFLVMYNCLQNYFFEEPNQKEIENVRRKYLKQYPDKKVILFAGRLNKEKGIEEVISAVKGLNREDWVLLIVGSNFYKTNIKSQYEQELRQEVKDIRDHIEFTGYIDNKQMPSIYRLADIVVLPSMWDEPAGMTMIEALACERPLITTYSGGIPEYVGNGGCVLIKRDKNIVWNITKAIESALDDPDKARHIAKKGKAIVSRYTEEYYYDQLMYILNI
jgi:spore coat protein SA